MKGKQDFTIQEIEHLKRLFSEKDRATTAKQKVIRAKIRKIGFYITDLNASKKGDAFTLDDFQALSWRPSAVAKSEGS